MKKFNILTNWITTWHHLLLPQFQTPNKVLHEQNQTIQTMEKEKEKTTLLNNNLTLINHSNHHPMLLPHYPQMLLTRTKTNLKIRCWNCWVKCQRRMQWMLVIFWSMINDQENEKLCNVKIVKWKTRQIKWKSIEKIYKMNGQRYKKDIVICLQILSLIWLWFYHHNILSL